MQHQKDKNPYISRCLSAAEIADILGISPSATYELMHRSDFPSIHIGRRMVVPADKLQIWLDSQLTNNGGGK